MFRMCFQRMLLTPRLKLEQCEPDTELKAKIDAWLAEAPGAGSGRMEVDG